MPRASDGEDYIPFSQVECMIFEFFEMSRGRISFDATPIILPMFTHMSVIADLSKIRREYVACVWKSVHTLP